MVGDLHRVPVLHDNSPDGFGDWHDLEYSQPAFIAGVTLGAALDRVDLEALLEDMLDDLADLLLFN